MGLRLRTVENHFRCTYCSLDRVAPNGNTVGAGSWILGRRLGGDGIALPNLSKSLFSIEYARSVEDRGCTGRYSWGATSKQIGRGGVPPASKLVLGAAGHNTFQEAATDRLTLARLR